MKRSKRIITALGILACLTTTAISQEITVHKSPNGHEFRHYAMKDAKRSAVVISWKHNLPGADANIITSRLGILMMLNGGADGKSPDEIIANFEDLDGGSRLFVQPREIRGFIVAPNENMALAADIANSVLARPNLGEKWFKREKKNLIDKATNWQKNIYGQGWNLARTIMFDDHPYQQFWSLSPVDKIEGITHAQVKSWHQNAFVLDDIKIVVAGSARPQDIGLTIDKALSGLPWGKVIAPRQFAPPIYPARTIVLHKPGLPKSLVLILGALPPLYEGNIPSYNLATGVLGYGKQSRLFKAVRSGLRAAYGFRASMPHFTREYSALVLNGEVETALLQQALDEIDATYTLFKSSGVGIIEFPFAKRFYRQRIEKEMKKPSSVAYMMMENLVNRRPMNEFTNLDANISNLSRSQVNKLIADTYPDFKDMLKIIVTPDASVIENACVISEIEQWKSCL